MTPQPQPEPRVSDEDREAAINAVGELSGCGCDACHVDAVISHGWGPRPTVSAKRMFEYSQFGILKDYLASRGIEVTE